MSSSLRAKLYAVQRVLRLSFVFISPLVVVLVLLGLVMSQFVKPMVMSWADRDLDERASLVSKALRAPIASALQEGNFANLGPQLDHLTEDERLFALAICSPHDVLHAASAHYPLELGCSLPPTAASGASKPLSGWLRSLHVNRIELALTEEEQMAFADQGPSFDHVTLVVLQNPSYAWRRSEQTERFVMWLLVGLGVILAMITVLVAHWSWRHWINGVRHVLRNGGHMGAITGASPEIQPLLPDLRRLLKSVYEDRRILTDTTIEWRPETLKLLLREHLFGDEVIVVSNREPYIHQRQPDGSIRVQRPASGLVTAVEPVMRACSGTWVAHGSGSADADVVDARSRVKVPPHPEGTPPAADSYTLHRVWLSEEEERGYYYGFANEGLWPLCHIAHVRPVFRAEDWQQYQAVNARFADAVVAEARTDNPVILVQDYHFALLPKLLRERLPKATILTFWHIPWPNPESFGICPWAREILEGLLGSTILGFHTPYHCQNFLETVDRFLESRIAKEDTSVIFQGQRTKVRDYPISIHWETPPSDPVGLQKEARKVIHDRFGLPDDYKLAIGVDRLDYTKGIVERMLAVERMLDKHPEIRGHFSLIQIAAPTRSSLEAYSRLDKRVREESARINDKFTQLNPHSPPPIIMLIEQHDSESVRSHYRACDIALVTSLHDGMNLVAKEFVAARDTEDGVLILSRFAGAAGEMTEALIVNPYHIDETADALAKAVSMHPAEQRERMRAMRSRLADFNIYRWAGRMLLDAADERNRIKVQDRIGRVSDLVPDVRFRPPWRKKPAVRTPPPKPLNASRHAHEV
ncbi:MAG: alpha,alpha-trehalose-phosphate synthase (UDP-forming) [Acidobacteriota bacterium]